jgi:hypothetical protein
MRIIDKILMRKRALSETLKEQTAVAVRASPP